MHLKKCEVLLKLAGLKGTPTMKASEYVVVIPWVVRLYVEIIHEL